MVDQHQDRRPEDQEENHPVPLIDQIHRLMHLWKAGDVVKVDDYLDSKGLRRNQLFHQLLQALIELAGHATEKRSLLESVSNHVAARGTRFDTGQREMFELASHLEREDLE